MSRVRVAVVDSGVEGLARSYAVVAGTVVPVAPRDVAGHGTTCAAIVRAVAPEVELHSVRVLSRRLAGSASDVAVALRWAIDDGMDVVNLSLSSRRDEHRGTLDALAREAAACGVVVVCAVSPLDVPCHPASSPAAVAVEAHAHADPWRLERPCDPRADLAAAGASSSFAAARVSGIAARLHPVTADVAKGLQNLVAGR